MTLRELLNDKNFDFDNGWIFTYTDEGETAFSKHHGERIPVLTPMIDKNLPEDKIADAAKADKCKYLDIPFPIDMDDIRLFAAEGQGQFFSIKSTGEISGNQIGS